MITEYEFKYCPSCKGNLIKKEQYLSVCDNCNLHYYINPKPTNAIILKNDQDEIVMVKRKHNPHKGKWDLAGGFVNPHETLEESVIREVKEELSIDIKNFTYVTSFYEGYEHGGLNSDTICFLFEGELPQNFHIIPSDDAESIAFFKPENIPFEDMAFEQMMRALQRHFSISSH